MTARELEVLALFADGLTFEDAADRLGVSYHTVKTHATHIREQLGARNKAHAVALAVREGLL